MSGSLQRKSSEKIITIPKEHIMKSDKKIRFIFKLWLLLYKLENLIWNHYSDSFSTINEGKYFHDYGQQPPGLDEIPF